ncbi:MAG TPA: SOS response-associated peptidase family protein [Sphingomonadaceae bacterium]|nr:SOS response-associated peptidase family protein [Sphingomonadaceae bacterium]
MCNLYRMTRTVDEIARLFDAEPAAGGANVGSEVYPGYPGLVVAQGEVRAMHWGFPLALRGKSGQMLKPRPVNNARTDKLSGGFWRSSFEQRRCLIPLDAWAEAEGPQGSKTRSWLSMPGGETFTAAGIWRASDEWGEVYSMVMTDAAGTAREFHTRMPVLLSPDDRQSWLSASPQEALELCRPYAGELVIERTSVRWTRRT